LQKVDLLFCVQPIKEKELILLKKGSITIGFLDPFSHPELVVQYTKNHLSAFSLQMIPRISRAQSMDALSSQASLAGYISVIMAAEKLARVFPMMITAAGTLLPAKILVIGVGISGLQAIATARRLGAQVFAFDPREEVEEQVLSLGARFIKVKLDKPTETVDGYVQPLTKDQLKQQQEQLEKAIISSDVVITAAQVFGKKAPQILKRSTLKKMKFGSVVIDLAADNGGNVEGSSPNKTIELYGVSVTGMENLSGKLTLDASAMISNNIFNLFKSVWNEDAGSVTLDLDDDIVKNCLVTHQGKLLFKR
jgi:H+-translocating NAD(P) transhydrogenase subunit alpha